ncbi:hypothetical protein BpHYR1_039160 [Brachionus plicatilis]|uniref:Uncharacterized protein n=1 Tax=Brachionus plicatilis TaxID=10195 RepID=A0A3M7QYV8_BRAPC|nr:hypothetical protein BpHYR1_039160 [Brachionus plicatilis]
MCLWFNLMKRSEKNDFLCRVKATSDFLKYTIDICKIKKDILIIINHIRELWSETIRVLYVRNKILSLVWLAKKCQQISSKIH